MKIARSKYAGIIACAAGGFPNGDGPLHERISEVKQAIEDGADEIDIVLDFDALMDGDRNKVATDLAQMRQACGDNIMKVILETPELDLSYVELAAKLALEFGADFIKTSTGKESQNATLPVSLVMLRMIRDYHQKTGHRVGFKPAGGIRTEKQALECQILMNEELGREWLEPELFRFGASGLLTDIERQLEHFVTGRYSAAYRQPMG